MATVPYDRFLPYLLPLVPNASEPVAIQALRNACIDFARDSLCLQIGLDAFATEANVADYDIDVPNNTRLAQVLSLYFKGRLIERRSLGYLVNTGGSDWRRARGAPNLYTQHTPDVVTLYPCPDVSESNAMTGIIAYVPTRSSTGTDELMLERHVEPIVRGAAAKLMQIPNEPFTNLQMAMAYTRQFTADKANVRSHVSEGQVQANTSVRLRRIY